jgi:hypothetical protein
LNITPSYPDHPLGKAQFVLLQQSRPRWGMTFRSRAPMCQS